LQTATACSIARSATKDDAIAESKGRDVVVDINVKMDYQDVRALSFYDWCSLDLIELT
jgi:hypothetical protein